jgi:oxalate decarboxylase/phosphoglucose isomerase-like protein (cupin superfamily)
MSTEKKGNEEKKLTTYEKWLATEGIDVISDYMVADARTIPLKPWPRKGGYGVHLSLKGAVDIDAAYICEIPSKSSLKTQKHLFEEMILILSGEGKTEVWNKDGPKVVCNWQEGSLFAIPLNAYHQHVNVGDEPARYLAVTDAPPVIDLFHNHDFVFNNDFVFKDRFNGEPDYFSGKGELFDEKIWDTNFVPNVETFELEDYSVRAKGGKSIKYELACNTMIAHISEYPVGIHKKAHRHAPGAHILKLSGKGYTLMWEEGKPKMRFDWQRGSLLVPGRMWFHQHFNTSKEPARYIAFRWHSKKFLPGKHFLEGEKWWLSTKLGGNQIEYEDEDPEIREIYKKELEKEGIEMELPEI